MVLKCAFFGQEDMGEADAEEGGAAAAGAAATTTQLDTRSLSGDAGAAGGRPEEGGLEAGENSYREKRG